VSRKWQIILACAAAVLALTGLAWFAHRIPNGVGHEPAVGRRVPDLTGREVRVPEHPQRILSLCTSATDTVLRIGAGGQLVAIDEYSRVAPGAEQIEVVGKGSAISQEAVLSRRIDLAFIWWYQDDAAAMLEKLSVPVVRIRSARATEVPAMIRLVGECVDCRDPAEQEAARVAQFLKEASASAAVRPRVYLEMYGAYKTVGRDTYTNDLLELAGGANVVEDTGGSVLLSAERLLHADPDAILFIKGFGDSADIAARPGLADLKAVRQGRIVPLERRWLIAGPALPEAVARMRALLAETVTEERDAHAVP
jgi:iron complex transport system substrate-binding protein